MAISRRVARPFLASIFVVGGTDALRNPAAKVKKAESVTGPLTERMTFLPNDPEVLVRLNGAVQVGAGLLLATGKFRRIASLALCGSIIPTTLAGHRFWEEDDQAARTQQQMHFMKNLGLLGGLILAAVDTEGQPSLGWRARRRGRRIEATLAAARVAGSSTARRAGGKAAAAATEAGRVSRRRGRRGRATARKAIRQTEVTGTEAVHALGVTAAQLVSPTVQSGLQRIQEAAADVAGLSPGAAVHHAASVATGAAHQLEPIAHDTVKAALKGAAGTFAPRS